MKTVGAWTPRSAAGGGCGRCANPPPLAVPCLGPGSLSLELFLLPFPTSQLLLRLLWEASQAFPAAAGSARPSQEGSISLIRRMRQCVFPAGPGWALSRRTALGVPPHPGRGSPPKQCSSRQYAGSHPSESPFHAPAAAAQPPHPPTGPLLTRGRALLPFQLPAHRSLQTRAQALVSELRTHFSEEPPVRDASPEDSFTRERYLHPPTVTQQPVISGAGTCGGGWAAHRGRGGLMNPLLTAETCPEAPGRK